MSYIVNLSSNGRISLPAEIRKKLGLTAGGALLLDETPHGIVLRTVAQSVAQAQAIAQKYPTVTSEAFLAQRRADSGE